MLDVPYNVKRALRLGRYKKNYKIKVYRREYVTTYNDIATLKNGSYFTVGFDGTYQFYAAAGGVSFGFERRTSASGETYFFAPQVGAGYSLWEQELKAIDITDDYAYYHVTSLTGSVDSITLRQPYSSYQNVYAFTIDNDTLIKESVKIDERMVTGKYLEFGLCEGSSLEFQYFNHENINGCELEVLLSIEYRNDNNEEAWYDIPMGWFTVNQCPMQFSTGIYKVTAYNKLKSDYLDAKANDLIIEQYDNPNALIPIADIKNMLLADYEINTAEYERVPITNTGGIGYGKSLGSTTYTFKGDYRQSWWTDEENNVTGYPWVTSWEREAILDANSNYVIRLQPLSADIDIGAYEWQFYNWIYNTLCDDLTGGQSKANKFITAMLQSHYSSSNDYRGWQSFFGIELTKSDDTVEYYSTVAYELGISGITGTIRDLIKKSITGYKKVKFNIPYDIEFLISNSYTSDPVAQQQFYDNHRTYYNKTFIWKYPPTNIGVPDHMVTYATPFAVYEITNYSDVDMINVTPADMADVTLRDIISAIYELNCQYGRLDRVTDLFSGIELNQGGLYPRDDLYPNNYLYPQGAEHPHPSTYLKLWTDTIGAQSFRYLIITYKTLVTEGGTTSEVDKVLQRTVNTNGTKDYNMSDNWLFRNLIWTDEEIAQYAEAMVEKMRNITWFPFEMWSVGLPYLEAGDAIEITDKEGNTYTSYILNRQLNGIHNLQDTFINGELDIF